MGSIDTTLALVTLDDTKEYLDIDRDTEDSILETLINAASEMANGYTGRHLLLKSYVEYYDGPCGKYLTVRNYPIGTVGSIYDDVSIPPAYGATTLVAVSDYQVDKIAGLIRRIVYPFQGGIGNVKVTYTAGYALASVPADLKMAVLKIIAVKYKEYQEPARIGVRSISQMDRTTTYVEDAIPKDASDILKRYRRVGNSTPGYA